MTIDPTAIDPWEWVSKEEVDGYLSHRKDATRNGSRVLVDEDIPLAWFLKPGKPLQPIIQEAHYYTGKDFKTLHDCAYGFLEGRRYTASGKGPPRDTDAETMFKNCIKALLPWQVNLLERICLPFGYWDGRPNYRVKRSELPTYFNIRYNVQESFEALHNLLDPHKREDSR